NIFKRKKEMKQEQGPEEKKEDPVDYNNLPLNTAAVATFKKKVAQELYEPWMDEGRKKSVTIESSTPKPELKNRSKFAFSDAYGKAPSPSLSSLADEQRKKEERADRQRIAKEQSEIEKQKAKRSKQIENVCCLVMQ
ncbi:hypothetical protein PENTCL1PPCAC_24730, partial [Pristionchus entomophagus]